MKIILRVTDVLTILGYRCRDTCQVSRTSSKILRSIDGKEKYGC